MMISPEAYLEQMKDATYEQLIKERDGLIRYVRRYEKTEKAGVRSVSYTHLTLPTTERV